MDIETSTIYSLAECEPRCARECILKKFVMAMPDLANAVQADPRTAGLNQFMQEQHAGLVAACRLYHDASIVAPYESELEPDI